MQNRQASAIAPTETVQQWKYLGPMAPTLALPTDLEDLFRYPIGCPHVIAVNNYDGMRSYVGRVRRMDRSFIVLGEETTDIREAVESLTECLYDLWDARHRSKVKFDEHEAFAELYRSYESDIERARPTSCEIPPWMTPRQLLEDNSFDVPDSMVRYMLFPGIVPDEDGRDAYLAVHKTFHGFEAESDVTKDLFACIRAIRYRQYRAAFFFPPHNPEPDPAFGRLRYE